MSARILVAEDDPKQAALIRLYLERDGHSVLVVDDGRRAVEHSRSRRPDLLVLDVMMPGVNGLDVCRILRAESDMPILLLTARSTEDDKLLGLDIGADDYVTKPYSPRELAARVRALLRRAGKGTPVAPALTTVGDLEIDGARFEVRVEGRPVVLTAKEFGILEVLAAEPGRVFTRSQIIDRAFGFDHYVLERTVDAHVMNLRRKIEQDPAQPRYVQTVYGRGYRLADHTAQDPATDDDRTARDPATDDDERQPDPTAGAQT
jgi:DNA-binding response OmpR family regulator